jgi:hypothetical protein
MTSFDFDTMSQLYKDDPEQFRIQTRAMLDEYVQSIQDPVSRKKCEGLQFKIDNELKHYQDPLARMNKMVEIFWKGAYTFRDALKGTYVEPTYEAKILDFKSNKSL